MAHITISTAQYQSRDQRRQRGYTVIVVDGYEIREALKASGFTFMEGGRCWARFAATAVDVFAIARESGVAFMSVTRTDIDGENLWAAAPLNGLRDEHITREAIAAIEGVTVSDGINERQIDRERVEWLLEQRGL